MNPSHTARSRRNCFSLMAYLLLAMAACLLSSTSAKAWGCNNGEQRYDIGPNAPAGSTAGDNQGQYYKGPDSGNNDYWVCEPKGWTPPSTTTGQTQSQNQNQSQTANGGSSTSKSSSTSGASATSNPVVTAKGGNATGGSVSNSGNSSNTNTTSSSAQGGAGGNASNNATGSGNTTTVGGDSYSNNVRVEAAAAAPEAFANSVYDCTKGFGVGGQGIAGGGTLSFGHADGTCQDLKIAESLWRTGSDVGYCTALSNDKKAKKLGITFDICMTHRAVRPVIIHEQLPAPAPVQQPPVVVVIPAPQPTPIASIPVIRHLDGIPAGECRVAHTFTNVCARVIGDNIRRLQGDGHSYVIIKGNGPAVSVISNAIDFISHKYDLDRSRWHLSVTDDPSITVQFSFVGSTQEQATN